MATTKLKDLFCSKVRLKTDAKRTTVIATWEFSPGNKMEEHVDHYEYVFYTYKYGGWYQESGTTKAKICDISIDNTLIKKVKFKVKAVSKTHKVNKKDKKYWNDKYTYCKHNNLTGKDLNQPYEMRINPDDPVPPKPDKPTLEFDSTNKTYSRVKATVSVTPVDGDQYHKTLITHVRYQFYNGNDNLCATHTVKISDTSIDSRTLTAKTPTQDGDKIKVRCRFEVQTTDVNIGKTVDWSDWSTWSDWLYTKPVMDKKHKMTIKAISHTVAKITVDKCRGAKGYIVEYTTDDSRNFTKRHDLVTTYPSSGYFTDRSPNEGIAIQSGHVTYFRYRAVNDTAMSGWSQIFSVQTGYRPNPPTTWSLYNSVMDGDNITFYWTHNPSSDNTACQVSCLRLTVDGEQMQYIYVPNPHYGDPDRENETQKYTINSHELSKGGDHIRSVKWAVCTQALAFEYSGNISDTNPDLKKLGYSDWSINRTVQINSVPRVYKPTLDQLRDYMKQVRGWSDAKWETYKEQFTDDSATLHMHMFPVPVLGVYDDENKIIAYEVRIKSLYEYSYVDIDDTIVHVNPGQYIFQKTYTNSGKKVGDVTMFGAVLTPEQLTLETGQIYSADVRAFIANGLSARIYYEFEVLIDDGYTMIPNLDFEYDYDNACMQITTSCALRAYDEEVPEISETPADISMDLYRIEYDGRLTEISSNIKANDNYQMVVIDPHPALSTARYRVTATSRVTGYTVYTDFESVVDDNSIIIQWDDMWKNFAVQNDIPEEAYMAGSLLRLPYNIEIKEDRDKDIALIDYIGRENPVSYFGTKQGETGSWQCLVPADDYDTIYALRRLQAWMGNCYVREPSGIGYEAVVKVSFSIKYAEVAIPVTLDVTRVEYEENNPAERV